jgi:hypothetical protein
MKESSVTAGLRRTRFGGRRGIAYVDNRITVQSFHDAKKDEWDDIC